MLHTLKIIIWVFFLGLHFLYTTSYFSVKQDLAFLATKQQEQHSKFSMDQKNREAKLLEEEERKHAAKSH
jgi:Na+-translocating ferredoxin:NAD+ oxidoreductase RnfG subunit